MELSRRRYLLSRAYEQTILSQVRESLVLIFSDYWLKLQCFIAVDSDTIDDGDIVNISVHDSNREVD